MTQDNLFFTVRSVADALQQLRQLIAPLSRSERLATAEAVGRSVARAPHAPVALPDFVRSAMDGYAVRAADTFGASDSLPAYLTRVGEARMGERPTMRIGSAQAVEIATGAMLPEGADAVVMLERTQPFGEGAIEVLAPVAPGENLVQIGEDVSPGAEIVPVGRRLRPQDLGGLLAVGLTEVEVVARPRVSILSSGDELVAPDQTPAPGQIRDINGPVLAALFSQAGAQTHLAGIAQDTFDHALSRAEAAFRDADVLVISAGSSVSTRDLTSAVINRLGPPGIVQHGLAVKPGKPTILAVCAGRAVIGLPGNPVSALLVARQIVVPLIQHLLGAPPELPAGLRATLTQNVASTTGREDTLPVRVRADGAGGWLAEPVFGKSNLIYTLINADGLIVVPLNSNGLRAGSEVEVTPF
jgi:molybdopterin molybdotransferase